MNVQFNFQDHVSKPIGLGTSSPTPLKRKESPPKQERVEPDLENQAPKYMEWDEDESPKFEMRTKKGHGDAIRNKLCEDARERREARDMKDMKEYLEFGDPYDKPVNTVARTNSPTPLKRKGSPPPRPATTTREPDLENQAPKYMEWDEDESHRPKFEMRTKKGHGDAIRNKLCEDARERREARDMKEIENQLEFGDPYDTLFPRSLMIREHKNSSFECKETSWSIKRPHQETFGEMLADESTTSKTILPDLRNTSPTRGVNSRLQGKQQLDNGSRSHLNGEDASIGNYASSFEEDPLQNDDKWECFCGFLNSNSVVVCECGAEKVSSPVLSNLRTIQSQIMSGMHGTAPGSDNWTLIDGEKSTRRSVSPNYEEDWVKRLSSGTLEA